MCISLKSHCIGELWMNSTWHSHHWHPPESSSLCQTKTGRVLNAIGQQVLRGVKKVTFSGVNELFFTFNDDGNSIFFAISCRVHIKFTAFSLSESIAFFCHSLFFPGCLFRCLFKCKMQLCLSDKINHPASSLTNQGGEPQFDLAIAYHFELITIMQL